jgi:hypothetical protein
MRRDSEARNLSQQRREERKTGLTIILQIEEMEYEEQAAKRLVLGQLGLRVGLGMEAGVSICTAGLVKQSKLNGTT